MIANQTANVFPKFKVGQSNLAVLECGENDIIQGATPTQVYNSMVTYCTNVRAQLGAKCIVWTVLSWNGHDSDKNATNALILADTTHFDGVVNYTGTPLGCDGCFNDSTYFQADKQHPTGFAIQTIEGPQVSAVVNALFP